MTYTVTLPWPHEDIRSNSRAHHMVKHRQTKKHRGLAHQATLAAKVPTIPNATIFVEYYPKARREDIQNIPTGLKAYIDGIADAMGCDDRHFRVDYPREWAGTRNPGEVVFRIVEPVKGGAE